VRHFDDDEDYVDNFAQTEAPYVESETERLNRCLNTQGDILTRALEEVGVLEKRIAALEEQLDERTIERDELAEALAVARDGLHAAL
jgi:septal ring factor EnvC (AmiA/AmiB activator)